MSEEQMRPPPMPDIPPPTPAMREALRVAVHEAVRAHFGGLLRTWDDRSKDMLDVLAESADARRQVRDAARSIKLAGWLGVFAMALGVIVVWLVLESERGERRKLREAEGLRRAEASALIVEQVRAEGRRVVEECQRP